MMYGIKKFNSSFLWKEENLWSFYKEKNVLIEKTNGQWKMFQSSTGFHKTSSNYDE